jgi:hypothetical protein
VISCRWPPCLVGAKSRQVARDRFVGAVVTRYQPRHAYNPACEAVRREEEEDW